MAAEPVPLVIVGGGRWGRVWAKVASGARGTGDGVTLVARSNADETRAWKSEESGIDGLEVCASLEAALECRPAAAIVATRPRDHAADAMAAMANGLDVLVEKPIADTARQGREMLEAAERGRRLLAIGTEFAFLPAFHFCAQLLGAQEGVAAASLIWDDPAGETRHGDIKRQHDDIGVLADLLPHAYSIFRIFAGGKTLRIGDFEENAGGQSGWIRMGDEMGAAYELKCNQRAKERRRILEVEARTGTARVDFASNHPEVTVNGVACSNPGTAEFTSPLRLELGAFFAESAGAIDNAPTSDCLGELLALQEVLEGRWVSAPQAV